MNTNFYLRLLLIVLADVSTEVSEIVGNEDAQTPFAVLRGKNLRDEVSKLLEVLDDRERKIIFQRFALDGGKSKTLQEVAEKFGFTRKRIRQLQNIALAKLRSRIRSDIAQNPGCLSDGSGLTDQRTTVSRQTDQFPAANPRHRRISIQNRVKK